MASQRQPGTLEPVVADAVTAMGLDLESVDVTTAGRRRLVKVVVDSDQGIGLDQVAEVSRAVSTALDSHDPDGTVLGGPYTLEVTSPGLDRPLTMPRHWRRARLRLVKVRHDDGGTFTARVGDSDEDGVELLVDGTLRRLRYADVAHAVVEVEFNRPPTEELERLANAERDVEEESR
ncbi:MAG TPA: ribosome maturation factor RimP [Actinophytocola sp.]|uniref:ribosome maturation factor RimP n=1 Tax=Actinophytocola sp. TaxID=1872138 RepID=UPI002DB7DEEC|nr:ribosome maturation factor RimP [Actinophytocola sp.]HEU5475011.1 ribosome maturation factor RimP [Actinophytocola sp.]